MFVEDDANYHVRHSALRHRLREEARVKYHGWLWKRHLPQWKDEEYCIYRVFSGRVLYDREGGYTSLRKEGIGAETCV